MSSLVLAGAVRRRSLRRAGMVALVVYALVMAWLVFGPDPGDEASAVGSRVRNAESAVRGPEAAPAGSNHVVFGLDDEEFSNVLLFVPLVPLVGLAWPRRWGWAVPGGVALSGVIEVVQWGVLDHRSPQVRDIVWNSTGTVVGAVGWAGVLAAVWSWRQAARGRNG